MKNYKIKLFRLIILTLVFSISLVGVVNSQELDTITMVFPRSVECLDDAHVHAGVEMGYFEEEGIKVNFEQAYGTSDVKMVATGQADVAYPSPYIQLMGHENDLPIISVYQVDVRNIFGFGVKPNSDIKSISDLKGKTIALGNASWSSISNPMLRHAGLDPSQDVEYITAGENRAQMVQEGKIDAVLTWEKEYQLWQAQKMDFRILSGEDVLDNCSNSIVTNTKLLEENPDLLARFLKAYAKGSYFTKLNPEAATQIVLEKYPQIKVGFPEALKAIEALVYVDHNEDTQMYGYGYHNPEKWNINIEDAKKEDMITTDVPLSKIYTNRFLYRINNFDHENIEMDAKNFELLPKYKEQL